MMLLCYHFSVVFAMCAGKYLSYNSKNHLKEKTMQNDQLIKQMQVANESLNHSEAEQSSIDMQ